MVQIEEDFILLVEDDRDLAEIIEIQLQQHGNYKVLTFYSGETAMEFLNSVGSKLKLCIFDIMLPGVFGIELCRFIRNMSSAEIKNTPIILLTALTSPDQIIRGLDAGADDYVTKPFDINVLLARVRAQLRRSLSSASAPASPTLTPPSAHSTPSESTDKDLSLFDLKINLDQCKVWLRDQEIFFTLSELRLLTEFVKNKNKVLTRDYLVKTIQGEDVTVVERTIDTHVVSIRKKLKDYASNLETVRGIGYRMSDDKLILINSQNLQLQ